MRGTVTNLRMTESGFIEVTITADASSSTPPNGQRQVAMVQVAPGAEPRLGTSVEVTLNVIG